MLHSSCLYPTSGGAGIPVKELAPDNLRVRREQGTASGGKDQKDQGDDECQRFFFLSLSLSLSLSLLGLFGLVGKVTQLAGSRASALIV